MAAVRSLLTFVDLNDAGDAGPDAPRVSVRARHEAVLTDGRHVVLLDDRGWGGGDWAYETVDEMKRTARFVVGPDEPFGGRSRADMEAGHWATLAGTLRQHGVEVAGDELKTRRHEVELSDRVLARIPRVGRDAG